MSSPPFPSLWRTERFRLLLTPLIVNITSLGGSGRLYLLASRLPEAFASCFRIGDGDLMLFEFK